MNYIVEYTSDGIARQYACEAYFDAVVLADILGRTSGTVRVIEPV